MQGMVGTHQAENVVLCLSVVRVYKESSMALFGLLRLSGLLGLYENIFYNVHLIKHNITMS